MPLANIVTKNFDAGRSVLPLPTLLIVDDEPLMTDMLNASLVRYGYLVVTAENGQQALEMIQERGLFMDAVITDMVMPLMNGLQLAKQLAILAPDIPVLLATGRDTRESDLALLTPNIVEVVQKPYQSSLLAERIKAHLKIG